MSRHEDGVTLRQMLEHIEEAVFPALTLALKPLL